MGDLLVTLIDVVLIFAVYATVLTQATPYFYASWVLVSVFTPLVAHVFLYPYRFAIALFIILLIGFTEIYRYLSYRIWERNRAKSTPVDP